MDSRARSSDCDNLFVRPMVDHYCRGPSWHTSHLIDEELDPPEGARGGGERNRVTGDVALVLGAMLCHKDFINELHTECARQCGDVLRLDENNEPVEGMTVAVECLDVMFTELTRDHFHKFAQMKGVTDITQQSIQKHAQDALKHGFAAPRIEPEARLGDSVDSGQKILEEMGAPVAVDLSSVPSPGIRQGSPSPVTRSSPPPVSPVTRTRPQPVTRSAVTRSAVTRSGWATGGDEVGGTVDGVEELAWQARQGAEPRRTSSPAALQWESSAAQRNGAPVVVAQNDFAAFDRPTNRRVVSAPQHLPTNVAPGGFARRDGRRLRPLHRSASDTPKAPEFIELTT